MRINVGTPQMEFGNQLAGMGSVPTMYKGNYSDDIAGALLGAFPGTDTASIQAVLRTLTMDEILALWDDVNRIDSAYPYADPRRQKARAILAVVVPWYQRMQELEIAVTQQNNLTYEQAASIPEARAVYDPVAAANMVSPDESVRAAQEAADLAKADKAAAQYEQTRAEAEATQAAVDQQTSGGSAIVGDTPAPKLSAAALISGIGLLWSLIR